MEVRQFSIVEEVIKMQVWQVRVTPERIEVPMEPCLLASIVQDLCITNVSTEQFRVCSKPQII